MASHASLAQQHCQAWDDTVQHVLLSLQKTIRSVPLSPILVICVRSTGTAVSYLELSLTQTMILVPVPSRPQPASLWAVFGSKMQYRSVVSDSCLQGKILVSCGTMHSMA